MCHFRAQNAYLPWTKCFRYKPLLLFHLLIGLFHCAKFLKIFTADPELWGCAIFGSKMIHLPPTHLPISSFYCAKFKKNSSSGSRVMRMPNFWAQNGPFSQMIIFSENLLMTLVSFIHAYLHAKNQNLVLIYLWNIDD